MPIAFVIVFVVAASAYPVVTVARTDVVIRIQVRSTARVTDWRRPLGHAAQRWLHVDPNRDPWDDPPTRCRVRSFGLAQLLVIWAIAAALILATTETSPTTRTRRSSGASLRRASSPAPLPADV